MSAAISVFSLGFPKKTAEQFFALLRNNQVKTVLDVRLNNVSQLAGFTKRDDLPFFLRELCDADYVHVPDWAPTTALLKPYKQGDISWQAYEDGFLNLMSQRHIEKNLPPALLQNACLLCSEHLPHQCHRRLVIEYLNQHSQLGLTVKHLV